MPRTLMIAIFILAGTLCGADAQEFLTASIKGDKIQETRVALTLANLDSFRDVSNKEAFLDVFEDVLNAGGDLDAGSMARIAGRVGISVEAVEEYFGAVNYYRVDGRLIIGLDRQANASASRNLARVAGYEEVGQALAEMLEPVAARRLGITPGQVRSFGEKIDVTAFRNVPGGVSTATIEADTYLNDLHFLDAKWTTLPDQTLRNQQLRDLTFILSNPQIGQPITKVTFPTTVPVTGATQAAIDDANATIRAARGITDPSVLFIEAKNVGTYR
jgi:hypothetical protein